MGLLCGWMTGTDKCGGWRGGAGDSKRDRDRERASERAVVSRRDHYLAAPHTSISPVSITLGRGYHINGEEGEGGGETRGGRPSI